LAAGSQHAPAAVAAAAVPQHSPLVMGSTVAGSGWVAAGAVPQQALAAPVGAVWVWGVGWLLMAALLGGSKLYRWMSNQCRQLAP